ncbi:MAG: hypothetical protein LBS56_09520 [Propionibacteriaceae bacterium]|jgi:hypothetical protein|nr:hypothetical protein [Propionibacteriaceae bacterium]
MALTTSESTAYTALRKVSGSDQAVPLSDDAVRALVGIAARDLGLEDRLMDVVDLVGVPELFDPGFGEDLVVGGNDPRAAYEAIIRANPEALTYIGCLGQIHKARLKYQRVLETQPFPTMDQIAPRSLLQHDKMPPKSLAALLTWRKWLYDLDNRAAQETGYLFEPVIAGAIGGIPCSAAKSPIHRASGSGGRQVDCLKDDNAYEFKIRITIAASGQGRWTEELLFPQEAKNSGYTPILIVLDTTPNPKLAELVKAFEDHSGLAFVGDDAWSHLKNEAGEEMGLFLDKYIRVPLDEVDEAIDPGALLPPLRVEQVTGGVVFRLGETSTRVDRPVPDDSPGTAAQAGRAVASPLSGDRG